jgi:Tfp pilus assembly protein PilO
MQLSGKSLRQYLAIFFLYAVAVVVLIFSFIPSITAIGEAGSKLRFAEEKLATLKQKSETLNNLNEAQLKSQLSVLEAALPSDNSIAGLLTGIENLARTNSVTLDSFNSSPGLNATVSAKPITFTTTISGDADNVWKFLKSLYTTSRLINVNTVSYKDSKTNLGLSVYYRPMNESLGEITSPVFELNSEDKKNLTIISSYTSLTTPPAPLPAGKANPFN